jgi:hypothetical protein
VAQFKRARLLLQGRFRGWVDANLRALQRVRHLMTPENQRVLDEFIARGSAGLAGAPGRRCAASASSARPPGQPRPVAGRADQSALIAARVHAGLEHPLAPGCTAGILVVVYAWPAPLEGLLQQPGRGGRSGSGPRRQRRAPDPRCPPWRNASASS